MRLIRNRQATGLAIAPGSWPAPGQAAHRRHAERHRDGRIVEKPKAMVLLCKFRRAHEGADPEQEAAPLRNRMPTAQDLKAGPEFRRLAGFRRRQIGFDRRSERRSDIQRQGVGLAVRRKRESWQSSAVGLRQPGEHFAYRPVAAIDHNQVHAALSEVQQARRQVAWPLRQDRQHPRRQGCGRTAAVSVAMLIADDPSRDHHPHPLARRPRWPTFASV